MPLKVEFQIDIKYIFFQVYHLLCRYPMFDYLNLIYANKRICVSILYCNKTELFYLKVCSPVPWACPGCCPWTFWSRAGTATPAAPSTSATSRRWRSCSASSCPYPDHNYYYNLFKKHLMDGSSVTIILRWNN